jgi:hypothetical protein
MPENQLSSNETPLIPDTRSYDFLCPLCRLYNNPHSSGNAGAYAGPDNRTGNINASSNITDA